MIDAIQKAVYTMAHNELRNYVLPGVSSFMVGGESPQGCVRLFVSSRNTQEFVTPHSHRFDFTCVVLKGMVRNVIYHPSTVLGDMWFTGTIRRDKEFGQYVFTPGKAASRYVPQEWEYAAGDTYSMNAADIHSIYFGAGTEVLFFEGPQVAEESVVLEPEAYGERVPTFVTAPWMFAKAS